MSYTGDKRHTQIDFKMLGGLENQAADAKHDRIKASAREKTKRENHKSTYARPGLRDFTLVEAAKAGVRAHEYIRKKDESPWEDFEKCWDLRLGVNSWITVAERRASQSDVVAVKSRSNDPLSKLVLVKKFEGYSVQENLHTFQQLQHSNIVSTLEILKFNGASYVVLEYMAYSISYVAGNPRLDEIRLAAILGQVLAGLTYLAEEGFVHSSLDCSSILIHPYRDVKIASLEDCFTHTPKANLQYVEALGSIITELMNGYVKEGAIGVDDLHRWPPGSNAVTFLSETTSAVSIFELTKHPLLQLPWRKDMLVGVVSFATVGTRIGYRYPPS